MADPRRPGLARTIAVLCCVSGVLVTAACSSRPIPRTDGPSAVASSAGVSSTGTASAKAPSTTSASTSASSISQTRAARGRILTVSIPGGASGFAARPARVYLPPAAGTGARVALPVLMLLGGTGGDTTAWLVRGKLESIMDAFAATHGGVSPVVVVPDLNGSPATDSECILGPNHGNVEQYLLSVVPAWVVAHLPATSDRRQWAIAGLSEGGTCALMLALRGYPGFRAFGDFSALTRPTVGDTDDPSATIAALFGGSRAAYNAHDPMQLLAAHRYPELSAWFETGAADPSTADQATAAAAARRAGVDVHTAIIPGTHTWSVWTAALTSMLPWLWARIGR